MTPIASRGRSGVPRALLAALGTVLIAALASAQSAARPELPPGSKVRETKGVTLVEVPVNVVGRDGQPVRGLSVSDFDVEDNGAAEKILSLDVIDLSRKAEADGPRPAAARRHFLFLFDLSFSKPGEIQRARDAAVRFVERDLQPGDLAAVGTTSIDKGNRLVVTFTSDRRQVVEAVRGFGAQQPDLASDPLAFAFVVPGDTRGSAHTATQPQERSVGGLIDPDQARAFAVMEQKTWDQYTVTRISRHLEAMGTFAAALDAVEGRKTIVFFSEGFEGRLLAGSFARERSPEDTERDNNAILTGRIGSVDLERRGANSALEKHLTETVALFRRSDCTIYPVDVAGLKDDGTAGNRSGADALFALANGTGGAVMSHANDLDEQVRRILSQTSLTYVLSFRPSKTAGDGSFHELKVRVNRPGARVAARAGYYESRTFRQLSPLARALSAADVITHEKADGGFPMEALAFAVPGKPLSRVPVVVEARGADLLKEGASGKLRLGLYVYAVDESETLTDYFSRSVSLDLDKEAARLREGGLRVAGSLSLPPGKYRVRAFLRNEESGRFAFRIVPLEVPDAGEPALRAVRPLFVRQATTGINLRDARSPVGQDPFELSGELFIPDVVPTLAPGQESRLCVLIVPGSAGADRPTGISLDAGVADSRGGLSRPARFEVLGRSTPDAAGVVKLHVAFVAGPLPPGDYFLRIGLRAKGEAAPATDAQAQAPFRIQPPA